MEKVVELVLRDKEGVDHRVEYTPMRPISEMLPKGEVEILTGTECILGNKQLPIVFEPHYDMLYEKEYQCETELCIVLEGSSVLTYARDRFSYNEENLYDIKTYSGYKVIRQATVVAKGVEISYRDFNHKQEAIEGSLGELMVSAEAREELHKQTGVLYTMSVWRRSAITWWDEMPTVFTLGLNPDIDDAEGNWCETVQDEFEYLKVAYPEFTWDTDKANDTSNVICLDLGGAKLDRFDLKISENIPVKIMVHNGFIGELHIYGTGECVDLLNAVELLSSKVDRELGGKRSVGSIVLETSCILLSTHCGVYSELGLSTGEARGIYLGCLRGYNNPKADLSSFAKIESYGHCWDYRRLSEPRELDVTLPSVCPEGVVTCSFINIDLKGLGRYFDKDKGVLDLFRGTRYTFSFVDIKGVKSLVGEVYNSIEFSFRTLQEALESDVKVTKCNKSFSSRILGADVRTKLSYKLEGSDIEDTDAADLGKFEKECKLEVGLGVYSPIKHGTRTLLMEYGDVDIVLDNDEAGEQLKYEVFVYLEEVEFKLFKRLTIDIPDSVTKVRFGVKVKEYNSKYANTLFEGNNERETCVQITRRGEAYYGDYKLEYAKVFDRVLGIGVIRKGLYNLVGFPWDIDDRGIGYIPEYIRSIEEGGIVGCSNSPKYLVIPRSVEIYEDSSVLGLYTADNEATTLVVFEGSEAHKTYLKMFGAGKYNYSGLVSNWYASDVLVISDIKELYSRVAKEEAEASIEVLDDRAMWLDLSPFVGTEEYAKSFFKDTMGSMSREVTVEYVIKEALRGVESRSVSEALLGHLKDTEALDGGVDWTDILRLLYYTKVYGIDSTQSDIYDTKILVNEYRWSSAAYAGDTLKVYWGGRTFSIDREQDLAKYVLLVMYEAKLVLSLYSDNFCFGVYDQLGLRFVMGAGTIYDDGKLIGCIKSGLDIMKETQELGKCGILCTMGKYSDKYLGDGARMYVYNGCTYLFGNTVLRELSYDDFWLKKNPTIHVQRLRGNKVAYVDILNGRAYVFKCTDANISGSTIGVTQESKVIYDRLVNVAPMECDKSKKEWARDVVEKFWESTAKGEDYKGCNLYLEYDSTISFDELKEMHMQLHGKMIKC